MWSGKVKGGLVPIIPIRDRIDLAPFSSLNADVFEAEVMGLENQSRFPDYFSGFSTV
jgi:hypothetical protein